MKVQIELTEDDIRCYIAAQLSTRYGLSIEPKDIPILVKSKNNYREQTWEEGRLQIKVELVR